MTGLLLLVGFVMAGSGLVGVLTTVDSRSRKGIVAGVMLMVCGIAVVYLVAA